ncbi:MAG: DNA pilot protein [Microvirus sp.]|nr:MAG: DNA pilot protein [Microvirus sp.]
MPIPLAGIAAMTNAGANVFNAVNTGIQNRANRRHAEKMFNWQNDTNISNWAMENEYNSPANQMKRLKEAGLNPALAYGGGATATGGTVGRSSAQSPPGQAAQVDGNSMGNFILSFMKMQLDEKRLDVLDAQTKGINEKTLLTQLQSQHQAFQNYKDPKVFNDSFGYQLDALKLGNEKTKTEMLKTEADTKFTLATNERVAALQGSTLQQAAANVLRTRAETAKSAAERQHILQQIENLKKDAELKGWDIKLREAGVSPGDPFWWRILNNTFDKLPGIPAGPAGKKLSETFRKNIFNPSLRPRM